MTAGVVHFQPRATGDAPIRFDALPPLSLYVHLPWCLKKCPYCDFNSHEPSSREGAPFERYVQALLLDLEASLPQVWGRRVQSVFLGGGTPSLFEPALIDRLLSGIRARLPLEPDAEISMEANPGTFERDRFRAFRDAGVNRLSVGVQSFDDGMLQAIGRVHDGRQAREALSEASEVFTTFNLDLMYALPGQTLAMLDADLDIALGFNPPHLSIYNLTLEPNTRFALHPPVLPDDDTASDMLDRIVERTQRAGLARYEVSAFAKPGHRCVHNLNYWQFGDYLGIGAGAHGKLSFADRIVRQVRWRDPATYMARAFEGMAMSNEHALTVDALPFEFMLNALRLKDGFALNLFAQRCGVPWTMVIEVLRKAQGRGLVDFDDGPEPRVTPTARGFDFLNDLQQLFLQPTPRNPLTIHPEAP